MRLMLLQICIDNVPSKTHKWQTAWAGLWAWWPWRCWPAWASGAPGGVPLPHGPAQARAARHLLHGGAGAAGGGLGVGVEPLSLGAAAVSDLPDSPCWGSRCLGLSGHLVCMDWIVRHA